MTEVNVEFLDSEIPFAEYELEQNLLSPNTKGRVDMKKYIKILISLSFVFSVQAHAGWELVAGGLVGYMLGSYDSSSSSSGVTHNINIDISSLNKTLVTEFGKIKEELTKMSEATLHSGQALVNTQGYLMLPVGHKFSNGTNAIKKTDADQILKELLEGKRDKVDELNVGYKDIMFLLNLIDLKQIAFRTSEFSKAEQELSRLNKEDKISSEDPHINLLGALIAYGKFKKSFDVQDNAGGITNPVRDAGETFFHMVLQKSFADVISANMKDMEKEQSIEYIDAISKDVISQNLNADPNKALLQIKDIVKKSNMLSDMEKLENVFLASRVIFGKQNQEKTAELDVLLSRLLNQKLLGSIEKRLQLAQSDVRSNNNLISLKNELIGLKRDRLKKEKLKELFIPQFIAGAALGIFAAVNIAMLGSGDFISTWQSVFQNFTDSEFDIESADYFFTGAPVLSLLGFGLNEWMKNSIIKKVINFQGDPKDVEELKNYLVSLEGAQAKSTFYGAAAIKAKAIFQPELMCKAMLTSL